MVGMSRAKLGRWKTEVKLRERLARRRAGPYTTPAFAMPTTSSRLAVLAAVAAAAALAAAAGCGPRSNTASVGVQFDTLVAYALNGTNPLAPSAFDLGSVSMVVPDGSLSFDVVFDINPKGRALLVPAGAVATDFGSEFGPGTRRVGLQRSALAFDSIQFAPTSHYFFDSTFVLVPKQSVIVATSPPGCATTSNPTVYGKLVLDSVNLSLRTIHFRATVDPNCGFRSFLPGLPTR
jgi:hypothetical protein